MGSNFLAAAFEHADAVIVAYDAGGERLVLNAAARSVFGSETIPRDHPLYSALEKGTAQSVSIQLPNRDSSVTVSVRPLLDAAGKKIGAVATYSPWSSTLESEFKRLELMLESTGEGIYCIDIGGRCTFVNGSAAAMLGHTRGMLIGKSMHEMMHHTTADGQPYPEEDCPIYRAFREGRGCRIDDEVFFRADGSFFPVEYSSYPILEQGVVQGAVVTFNDITRRRQNEAAMRRSEAKYRNLFDTVSEGVFQTSAIGEVLAANRALVEMLGYGSESELRAVDANDLYVDSGDRERLTAQLERDGKLVSKELRLKCKDGRVIQVIENSHVIRDDRKRVIYYEGTLTLAG